MIPEWVCWVIGAIWFVALMALFLRYMPPPDDNDYWPMD